VAASCTLGASGTCTAAFTGVAPGSATVSGTYGADATHNGSSGTSATITVTIPSKDDTSTSVSCTPASINIGGASTCTVTVTDTTTPTNTPTGTVTFASSDTAVGTVGASCTLDSTGSCPVSFTGVAPGTATATGNYLGDSTHNGSSGTSAIITVTSPTKDDTSTSVSCPASLTVGLTGSCTVTVADITNPANTPTGSVSLASSDITIGTVDASCTLDSSGGCTVTISGVAVGSFAVTGTYGGDPTHNGSSGTSASIAVTAVEDFTISASPTSVTATVNVAGASTITIGSLNGFVSDVALTSDHSSACTLTPSTVKGGSGTSVLSCTFTAAGSVTVTVTGTSGSLSHTTSVGFTVIPVTGQRDFTISANPTSLSVLGESSLCEGSSALCDDEASTTITLTSLNGFNGTVRLIRSVSPRNGLLTVYCRPGSVQLLPGGTRKATCFVESEINPDTSTTFTVTITGVAPLTGQSHSVIITVTVIHNPNIGNEDQNGPLGAPSTTFSPTLIGGALAAAGAVATSVTHANSDAHGHGQSHGHGHGHHQNHSQ